MPIFELTIGDFTLSPSWYGMMYAIGFIVCYEYMKRGYILSREKLDSLLLYVFFGVIAGGRLGYVIFYDFGYFSAHPEEVIRVWNGGMSFHGGAIGVILALIIFSYREKIMLFSLSDRLVTILPIALGLGRIGNYINGELPGYSPYHGPLPMVVDGVAHFPSPLFQAFLEGGILLILMLILASYTKRPGMQSAYFLIGYGFLRIFAEFFRLPDTKIGYLYSSDWITLGMIYSIPMIILGIYLLFVPIKKY